MKINENIYVGNTGIKLIDLTGKDIMTIGLRTDTVITSSSSAYLIGIPLYTLESKVGTRLTHSNGIITIGSNISKILVSGNITAVGNTSMYGLYIRKNGNRCAISYTVPASSGFSQIVVPPMAIEVTEGDIIDLAIYIESNGVSKTIRSYGGQATYLTVEVIE